MDLGIAGKRAAVAAASKGLGLGVARALAAEGVRVAICSRSRDAVDAAVAICAEIITARTGRPAASLSATAGPIH